jgi:hypothetical protein
LHLNKHHSRGLNQKYKKFMVGYKLTSRW